MRTHGVDVDLSRKPACLVRHDFKFPMLRGELGRQVVWAIAWGGNYTRADFY